MAALISQIFSLALAILRPVLADAVVARESPMCEEDCDAISLLQTGLKMREEQVETQAWASLSGPAQHQDRILKLHARGKAREEPEIWVQCPIARCANSTHIQKESKDGHYYWFRPEDMPEVGSWLDPTVQLYGLSNNRSRKRKDGMFELVTQDGKCSLTVPFHVDEFPKGDMLDVTSATKKYVYAKKPSYSGFTHGECPRVLPVDLKKRMNTWYNPGLARLPAKLKTAFPTAHWLMMSRNHVQLLDANFERVTSTTVQFRGIPHIKFFSNMADDDLFLDEEILRDTRIYLMNDDTIALSFVPYDLQDTSFKLEDGNSWFFHQVFGTLQLDAVQEATGVRLAAWIDRKDCRTLEHCGGNTSKNFWPEHSIVKNMNILQRPTGDDLYLVDWIHPTAVGKLDLTSSPEHSERYPFFGVSCFGYGEPTKLQDDSIFGVEPPVDNDDVEERRAAGKLVKQNRPQGSSGMIWIDEIQEFLGVGHFHRGLGDSVLLSGSDGSGAGFFGHHYTHLFFTMSKDPPFRLTSISTEFCFPSDMDSEDCEGIQFVTSLERDGNKLAMSYGVMDIYAYVATVDFSSVLKSLRPVA